MISSLERLGDRLAAFLARPGALACIALLLSAGLTVWFRVPDPDLFARVAVGNLIFVRGEVPHLDPFAYTPLKPLWFDHEWLSGVFFFLLVRWGGEGLLLFVKVAACGATVYFVARAAALVARAERVPFMWIFAASYLVAPVWLSSVRSHIVTYLALAAVIYSIERFRVTGRRGGVLAIPFLMPLWVNSHGGFVVGLGYLGVVAVGSLLHDPPRGRFLLGVVVAAIGATLINPYGPGYLRFIAEAVTMPRPYVTEWYPPLAHEPESYPFFIAVAALVIGGFRRWRSVPPYAVVMLVLAAAFAFSHVRLVPIFGLFAAVYGWPLLQRSGAVAVERGRAFQRLCGVLIVAVVSASVAVVRGAIGRGAILDYESYPRSACEWLWSTGARGRLLVDFDRGSFALWRLYPRFQISLDGRYEELYPDSTIELVVAALDPAHPRHGAAFEAVRPTEIVVDATHRGFAEPTVFGPEWRVGYKDERFAILSSRPLSGGDPVLSPVWEPRYRREDEQQRVAERPGA